MSKFTGHERGDCRILSKIMNFPRMPSIPPNSKRVAIAILVSSRKEKRTNGFDVSTMKMKSNFGPSLELMVEK